MSANDFDDFQAAQDAYDAQDYERAAQLFETMVGGPVPRLTSQPLIVESRKYLAATYMFLGREPEADATFERLLRDEPDYQLDPMAFPDVVVRVFARVKERLAEQRREAAISEARAREQQRLEELQQRMEQKARAERLLTLAETERVERINSRWIAMVPFGVGQFQNEDNGLGLLLAVSQGLLLATSITTYAMHEGLRGTDPVDVGEAEFAVRALVLTNRISLGMFGVLAVTGIIDAQARFKRSRSYDRKREIPPDLQPSFQVGVGPGAVDLRLSF